MTRRQKAIAFFVTLCVLLVAAAVSLNIGWVFINSRSLAPLVLGVISFALIIAGLIVYTVFLVLEIKRNEDHDTFINAVTHELKTPIASMRLYLQTLQSRDIDEQRRQEFYAIMLADADRLHHTVDQVLAAGASGQKAKAVIRSPIDASALARDCVRLALARHHLDAGAITLDTPADGPTVNGDAEQLATVVTNLLDNAVKYSAGNVRVAVSVAVPAPDTVWIRVQDRGMGIAPKQLKRIFKRFYRVQARDLRNIKGTGLGLYIVRSIARAHNGRVFAQSEGLGRGATFTLELPRLATDAVTPAEGQADADASHPEVVK
ncbi:MAG: HAMP domain-containing sensor histidine kinase [Acidobacteria bacterium]|nr:HAMP domain-containing sensor histidine kinase [Acidobacteriota bacterium]